MTRTGAPHDTAATGTAGIANQHVTVIATEHVLVLAAKSFEGFVPPARACFAVQTLPKGALVEIEAVAHLPDGAVAARSKL